VSDSRLHRTATSANRVHGLLFFRALGTLCLVAMAGAMWVGWYAWSNWEPQASPVGIALSAVFIAGIAWAAIHCFSPRRTLIEALDAMEGGAGDLPRRTGEATEQPPAR
jgi:hypothetical protein